MPRSATAMLVLVVLAAPDVQAQAVDRRLLGDCASHAARLAEYERFVEGERQSKQIPGLTVGFFDGGCTWVAAFGMADLENRVAASVDSAYRYASVQKSMTALAILQLAERGQLDLDAEVQKYVTYFPDLHPQRPGEAPRPRARDQPGGRHLRSDRAPPLRGRDGRETRRLPSASQVRHVLRLRVPAGAPASAPAARR